VSEDIHKNLTSANTGQDSTHVSVMHEPIYPYDKSHLAIKLHKVKKETLQGPQKTNMMMK
jgi:hypothetical protein